MWSWPHVYTYRLVTNLYLLVKANLHMYFLRPSAATLHSTTTTSAPF